MASSGTINNTFRTGYAIRVVWNINSQDAIHNTSSVTAKVQLVSLGSTYNIIASATKYGSLTINGVKYEFTFNASLNGSQVKTIYTKTVTVAHNSDGSKTCAFATTCGINVTLTGVYWGNVSASGNGVFNAIGRASSISSVTSPVTVNGSNTITVNISRASSSFTHTVVFKFGSYSYTATGVGISTSYAVPMTWLNAIPNSTTGSGTVTITAYSGSTKIGASAYTSFQLVVPDSVKPSISSIGITEASEGIAAQFGGYVQGKTKFNTSIIASGSYSSTITSYKTTVGGVSYYGNPSTSGIINASGSVSLSITVTDSRGMAATETRTRTVMAYASPKISRFNVYRSNASGTQVYEGCCVAASMKFDISAVNNMNTKSYLLEYKLKTASTWSTLASGSAYSYDNTMIFSNILTTDNSYDLRLTVTDFFTSSITVADIPTAFTLLDFRSNGKGIAFGKVSEADKFECNLPAVFTGGIDYGSGNILWSGGLHMNGGQSFNLPELISNQPSGIVLVFSPYLNNVVQDSQFNSFFISKQYVANHPGDGSMFIMTTNAFSNIGTKYIYISNGGLSGNASNTASGTANGITYNNANFVLRYVIGI